MAIVVISVVVFVVIGAGVSGLVAFKTYFTPSGAMEPTLRKRDTFVVNRLAYVFSKPQDGDIVVFDPPLLDSNRFIKRVIATPGERLRVLNGRLYRNGAVVNESFVARPTAYELEVQNYNVYVDGVPLDSSQANIPPRREWTSPDTVPPHCYLLMGDNRNNSEDSHIWGFAESNDTFYSGPMAGRRPGAFERVAYRFYPLSRAGDVK